MQPEVMARRGHQEKDQQSKKSECLKGKAREAAVTRIAHEDADQGVQIAQRVELNNGKRPMPQREYKHDHAQMPAVIEQRQKSPVQTAERADAQDDMQKQQCRGS